jgi:hypothetical protein
MIEGAVRLPRPSPFDKLRGFGALQNDVENPSLLFPYKGKTKQLFLSVKLITVGKTWIPVFTGMGIDLLCSYWIPAGVYPVLDTGRE